MAQRHGEREARTALQVLAGHLATAIGNARLLAELRKNEARLSRELRIAPGDRCRSKWAI